MSLLLFSERSLDVPFSPLFFFFFLLFFCLIPLGRAVQRSASIQVRRRKKCDSVFSSHGLCWCVFGWEYMLICSVNSERTCSLTTKACLTDSTSFFQIQHLKNRCFFLILLLGFIFFNFVFICPNFRFFPPILLQC